MSTRLQKITPFLWFDDRAEEAAQFYTSIFPNSRITATTRYGDSGHGVAVSVMTIEFELDGQLFVGLNGGPHYKFTEAVSFVVHCETQAEVDYYWEKLTDGGKDIVCGWLKDRFGVSWQVVPVVLMAMMKDSDAARKDRVTKAMLAMTKMEIAGLEAAFRG